jgi:cardiolipin synthase A/B
MVMGLPIKRIRRVIQAGRSIANAVHLLHDGVEAIPAMLAAIRAAEHEVLLEMYWFGSDATGMRFTEALTERAKAGVCVRVIYDAVGSLDTDLRMFDGLRAAGAGVYEFNPVAPWRARFRLRAINRRDHRKLLVCDGHVAYTGGLNLGDPWAPKNEGGQAFRDDVVEVRGEAALELRALFYRTYPDRPLAIPMPPRLDERTEVTVLASDLWAERRGIYDGYLNAIARASREVVIANSYFIPKRRVLRALARASSRGVRVRVLVPRATDVRVARLASQHLYERLLEDGVEIYEWLGGILHSKSAVVDDEWCTIGSFNFDARSIHNNLELNLAIRSRVVARTLRERLDLDFAEAERVTLAHWQKRGLFERFMQWLFYMFRWAL